VTVSVPDYVSALIGAVFAIAVFLNLRNGTLGEWLKAKFLGLPRPKGAT